MDLKREIMELSALRGVSGGEKDLSEYLARRQGALTDSVRTDRFGNVIALRRSERHGAPKLMINVHMDQVGLMVTEVTEDGFARFSPIGADVRVLLSNEMLILTRRGPVKAVISALPPHLQNDGDELKPVAARDMTLDLGMNGERAREMVRPGDLVVYDIAPVELLGSFVTGPAMDNRAGLAAVLYALELLDAPPACNLVVAGATRGESGSYGAMQCVDQERPDYIVVVDACHARTPDTSRYERVHEQGAGPVIGRGANSSPRLAERLIDAAVREGVGYQLEAIPRTSNTDAWAAQIAVQGAVTAVVSLPVKYMHTPVEVLDVNDAAALGRLLSSFCRTFDGL